MPDGVEIDTGKVGEFAAGLRTEANTGLAEAATRGRELHGHGVVFGDYLVGNTVLDAKMRYAKALEHTEANLRAYQEAAVIFADVAERIARDFAAADLASADAQRRIKGLLNDAITKANEATENVVAPSGTNMRAV